MSERYRRRVRNPFNPYIVLADVTIATLVVLIVLLMFYGGELRSAQETLRRIQETAAEQRLAQSEERVAELETELGQLKARDQEQQRVSDLAKEKAQKVSDRLRPWSRSWSSDGFYVNMAHGELNFLIRTFGPSDKPWLLWDLSDGLSANGEVRIQQLIDQIKGEVGKQFAYEPGHLIEIRVEGHCSNVWSGDLLNLSLRRARKVRDLFPKEIHPYISVSGFGADRPAYETTAATIGKHIDDGTLRSALKRADTPLEREQLNQVERFLGQEKNAIRDRIDILLVYSGVSQDNNYVYPRITPADRKNVPVDQINDVSYPWTDRHFLTTAREREESP